MSIINDIRMASSLFDSYIRPYWKRLAVLIALNTVVGFLMSLRPLVIAPGLEAFMETKTTPAENISDLGLNNLGTTLISFFGVDPNNIVYLGMFVATLFILTTVVIALLGFTAQVLLIITRTAVLRNMTIELHKHLLTLPMSFFQKNRAGDLVSRVNNDVAITANSMDSIITNVLQSFARIIVTVTILFYTDVFLSIAVVAMGLLHMGITKVLGKRVQQKAKNVVDKQGTLSAVLMESFIGVRMIKSFAAETYDSQKITSAANIVRRHMKRFGFVKHIETPVRMILDSAIVGAALILIFYTVSQGRMNLQAAALFFYLSQQLVTPISEFFRHLLGLNKMLGGAGRIIEIFETRSDIKDGELPLHEFKDNISLDNVTFSYEANMPVLKNIDLKIERGQMVAIVGPSGAGKSTLIDLILRLYDTNEGLLSFDGIDIRKFKQQLYRRNFGVVAQESLLFNASVEENIIYSRQANKERLNHAIWAANAEEFIKGLPQGLKTSVGDMGVRLSGGQRQRIAIARAIYDCPSILVLDEATSSLDSESERAVQKAIDRISKEMTLIVIAHRLSTITHADKIVVLTDGQIEAVGSHGELLSKSPTYQKLYNSQFSASKV